MNRAHLVRLASFDGVVRVDASELKELLDELKAAEKKTVASLFDLLDTTSAGSMHLSTSDEWGNIQTLVIAARDENAAALMELYRQIGEEGARAVVEATENVYQRYYHVMQGGDGEREKLGAALFALVDPAEEE